jgi:hypothetical protein
MIFDTRLSGQLSGGTVSFHAVLKVISHSASISLLGKATIRCCFRLPLPSHGSTSGQALVLGSSIFPDFAPVRKSSSLFGTMERIAPLAVESS